MLGIVIAVLIVAVILGLGIAAFLVFGEIYMVSKNKKRARAILQEGHADAATIDRVLEVLSKSPVAKRDEEAQELVRKLNDLRLNY